MRSGGVDTRSLPFRRGLLAACWTAFLAVVSDVAGWEVDDAGALATGAAGELRAPRLKTGCWLGHTHHSPLGFRAFALAAAAFFARAVRSSDVMVSRLRLPPIGPPRFPPFRPASWKNFSTSGGSCSEETMHDLPPVVPAGSASRRPATGLQQAGMSDRSPAEDAAELAQSERRLCPRLED
jgi:hypothetical protein